VAVPPNKIWVINTRNQTISIVDIRTSQRERVFATLELDPDSFGLAYAAGSVWISGQDDTVVRLSPSTQLVQARIPVGGNITLMAAGYGRVWVNAHDALRVVGIDPRTVDVVVRGKIGAGSNGLAIGEGSVWVPNFSAGTVSKVDPRTGRSVQIPVAVSTKIGSNEYLVPGGPSGAGFGFGFVWVTDPRYGVVYRMAPATGEIMSTIRVGAKSSNYVSGVAVADGSVWVSSPGSKTIVRINPTTDQVESRIPIPFTPQDVIAVNGDVWVTLAE
jgi:streptogramin lyase